MSPIDLRLRDLNTGDASIQSFATEQAACAWLRARPRFVEVLGVASASIAQDIDARLRAALRPLDADEKAREEELDAAVTQRRHERQGEEQKRAEASELAHKEAIRTADPDREMEVHYTYNGELAPTDPADTRPISLEVKADVLAWVDERNEWVESRNQVVGDAKVTVWPRTIPKGQDRVQRGTFIPVSAPEKKTS
jgi:hypothetical protein